MDPQDFQVLGVAVIPVIFASKKPSVRWQQYQRRLPSQGQIARWFRPGRCTNAAVVCGWQGLTVLDFDTFANYVAWKTWAVAVGGIAERVAVETYRVKTSRGIHVYIFVNDTPRCGHFQFGDIKGQGGYVLIPPSIHPSGSSYTAINPGASILRIGSLREIVPDAPEPPAPRIAPPVYVFAASALWPATAIEQIKQQTLILTYFPDAKPTGSNGRWYMARCPFHDDQAPSMWIDTQRGICGCYAGCTDKPFDVLDLHRRLHGGTIRDTVRSLAKLLR